MAIFSDGVNDKYLDRNGLDYLLQELDKRYNSTGGNVDLSNYYNKSEIDTLLSAIGSGNNGVGIQSVALVNYELIVTLTDSTVINLGNVRGEKGEQGIQGEKGVKGNTGESGVNGTNGTNGADGRGITSITKTGTEGLVDTYTITYTDNTTSTFTVTNGSSGSGSSGGSTDVYSTEETAIGTWIDGKTIYRKVASVESLPVVTSGVAGRLRIYLDTPTVSYYIRMTVILKYSSTVIIADGAFSNIQLNPSTSLSTYGTKEQNAKIVCMGAGNSIDIYFGKDWSGYSGYIIAEYIK